MVGDARPGQPIGSQAAARAARVALALEEIEDQILEAEERHHTHLRTMRRLLDTPLNQLGAVRRYVQLLFEGHSMQEMFKIFGKLASSGWTLYRFHRL
jgi:hypothetical protein